MKHSIPQDTFDFYELFDEYKIEFTNSRNYAEFCTAINKEYLAKYVWAPKAYETAKAGKRTYHALIFPRIESFCELFSEAKLLPTPIANRHMDIPQGFRFLGGNGSICGYFGGTRGYSKTMPDTRSHYGATFYGTYVLPKPETAVRMTLDPFPASYEAIPREDGILILARDSHCIGSDWLALLPKSESIETLFDDETKALLAKERRADKEAWGS